MRGSSPGAVLRRAVLVVSALGLACTGSAGIPLPPDLELVKVVSVVSVPVGITDAGDGSGRLFIVEKAGRIRVVDNGSLLADPFLDITSLVTSSGVEQGLVGLAFDPDYPTNGDFYVYYTRPDNAVVLAHYNADPPGGNTAGPTGTVLWMQPKTTPIHNGGQLAFGPDGYLYVSVGDGGPQGDPADNAQNLLSPFGKILRIAVDGANPYTIPPSNPHVGDPSALDEVWQSGLRNPWRFSFDRLTGDLFIGDVGYQHWEEIDHQEAASAGGENWGWRCYEGAHPFNLTGCGPVTDYQGPILEYTHASDRCAVTGGFRYRGPRAPDLAGAYLFGDYCTGEIFAATYDEQSGSWSVQAVVFPQSLVGLRSFGEDELGDLYVVAGSTVYVVNEVGLILSDGFESGTTTAWSTAFP